MSLEVEKWKEVPNVFSSLLSFDPLVRFILKDDVVTDWASWVISPAVGYLETQHFGPFSIQDVRTCEIKTGRSLDPQSNGVLTKSGFEEVSKTLLRMNSDR